MPNGIQVDKGKRDVAQAGDRCSGSIAEHNRNSNADSAQEDQGATELLHVRAKIIFKSFTVSSTFPVLYSKGFSLHRLTI